MRDISKPTSLSLSQEAGGLPSGHGNRVPQAPPTHEKRTDSRLSWERAEGVLLPSSAFCRPGPVLGPQGPNSCFPRALKGCLVVLRFFRYIFCTLWKECVCDRGPARAWGRGRPCQTFPGGGLVHPSLTSLDTFMTPSVLMILFRWEFFSSLNLLLFFLYLLLGNNFCSGIKLQTGSR